MKFFKKIQNKSGMTAIELVVVMGIFAAISSTVLFNYRDFSSNIALQNLAQDIALQIKQAQTEAVSGRLPVFPAGSNQSLNPALVPLDWTPSYGIAFDINMPNSNFPLGNTGFVYYFNKGLMPTLPPYDRDFYDFTLAPYTGCGALADSESECLQEIEITSGDYIDMICFDFTEVADTCDGTDAASLSNQVFISFTRPRGNAIILDGAPDDGGISAAHSNVYLRLASVTGTRKFVAVWSTGYISIR